eukprot:2315164-Rhodomonas_salina.5
MLYESSDLYCSIPDLGTDVVRVSSTKKTRGWLSTETASTETASTETTCGAPSTEIAWGVPG